MNCRISFKHMKKSQPLTEYTESKILPKIERFSTKPVDTHVTFFIDGKECVAHCNVAGGDGFNYQIEARTPDPQSTVDQLAEKLESLLKKHKEKIKHHKKHNNIKTLPVLNPFNEKEEAVDAEDLIKFEKSRLRRLG